MLVVCLYAYKGHSMIILKIGSEKTVNRDEN